MPMASDDPRPAPRPRSWRVAACLVLLAGCRQEMYDQPRFEPLDRPIETDLIEAPIRLDREGRLIHGDPRPAGAEPA